MELVIDANRVIAAALAPGGNTADIIFSNDVRLFAPEFLREEIEEHKDEFLAKSGLSDNEFAIVLSVVFSCISLIPASEFSDCIAAAEKISPDSDDTEYVALALKKRCVIWSEDKALKAQTGVEVITTGELIRLLSA